MEAIVVVIALAVLVVMAMPAWNTYAEKQKLKGAAEILLSDLNLLRSEAVQRNKTVMIRFVPGTSWCYGLSENTTPACDCATAPQYCTLNGISRVTSFKDFKPIQLISTTFTGNQTGFEPVRGLALNPGTILLRSTHDYRVTIELNPVGRIAVCSNTIAPFPPC